MPEFNAKHVRQAFAALRKDGLPKGLGPSTKWDILSQSGERFPPKAVLFLAKEIAGDESYSGGGEPPTNDPLRARGFQIVLKDESTSEQVDLENILGNNDLPSTTKKALVNARLGQGGFREALIELWNSTCPISGISYHPLLKASHIKPWRDASDTERLDPYNGLLLAANLDALFDRYLISFDSNGTLLVSSSLPSEVAESLHLTGKIAIMLKSANLPYLEHHRSKLI